MAAAEYLSGLHTNITGQLSISQTPLEFIRTKARLDQSSIWLLSAGGRNIDILRAMRRAINVEPAHLAILCASKGSPISKLVGTSAIDVLEYPTPAGKDGFLATNSLAAFLLLIARAYSEVTGSSFPASMNELLERALPGFRDFCSLRALFDPLLSRPSWLVIFDPGCRAIASDLESRFAEAALGSVQTTDIRNFAHGRHHWLAKRGSETAVVLLSQPGSEKIANKTLNLLPHSVPRAHLQFAEDPFLTPVGGILLSMEIAGWTGFSRGIDPGRPGVPEFGRKLYNLTVKPFEETERVPAEQILRRKTVANDGLFRTPTFQTFWQQSLTKFIDDLYHTPIRGVVFDYDGTLVDVHHRFQPPSDNISSELVRLLEAGIRIGIATGRGKSVRRDLQQVIPIGHWQHVFIGYHNGSDLGRLDNEHIPPGDGELNPAIVAAMDLLKGIPEISPWIKIDASRDQLSLQWNLSVFGSRLTTLLDPILPSLHQCGVRLVTSGHSIDLLASGVSKRSVIPAFAKDQGIDSGGILTIGDQGRPPGNDSELLSHRPSLSVDQVSSDPGTCWRLSPPMLKGPAATLWYLSRLTQRKLFPRAVFFKKGSLRYRANYTS